LEKKITPHGVKNRLIYDINELLPLITIELKRLMAIRNALIKILAVVPAARNKKLVLNVLEYMFQISLNTGGGAKPPVLRVIKLYETEGKITKKRKADGSEEEAETDEAAVDAVAVTTSCDAIAVVSVDSQSSSSSSSSSSTSSPLTRAASSDHISQKAKNDNLNEWWDVFDKEDKEVFDNKEEEVVIETEIQLFENERQLTTVTQGEVLPMEEFGLFSDDDLRQDESILHQDQQSVVSAQ